MEPQVNKLIGLDNIERSAEDEQILNEAFSIAFNTPTGIKVLEYLRSISIETVAEKTIKPRRMIELSVEMASKRNGFKRYVSQKARQLNV